MSIATNDFEFEQRTDTLRKLEFDKGIPLSMDFPDNSVSSVDKRLTTLGVRILKKIISRPIFLLMFILYIFFIIGIVVFYNEVMSMEM